jgi:hypothetical protein
MTRRVVIFGWLVLGVCVAAGLAAVIYALLNGPLPP